jgi:hypothetical protein
MRVSLHVKKFARITWSNQPDLPVDRKKDISTMQHHVTRIMLPLLILLMTGLTWGSTRAQNTPPTASASTEATDESDYQMPAYSEHYTYHQRSGNRVIAGRSTFPDVQTLDSPALDNPVQWIVGVNSGQPDWLITDGQQRRIISLLDNTVVSAAPEPVPPGVPLLVRDVTSRYSDFPAVQQSVSALSHPVLLNALPDDPLPLFSIQSELRFAGVGENGDLLLLDAEGNILDRAALNIQADARVVLDAAGRIAVYANATDARYVHGIMGDNIEGAALVILRAADDTLTELARVDLPGDAVYEGLSPLWADVNQDGVDDLVTTVSDGAVGSRIRVYLTDESSIMNSVDGAVIGRPGRWQHQLAWDAFAPDGTYELVDVLTPHIGGTVRFYRFTGDSLEIVAEQPGYTSHVIGSRNLDLAVSGDFNGDGQPEIVLPSQNRQRIAGIQHTDEGASVVWELPLDGVLTSNLFALRLPDGRLALAAGRDDGRVRVWLPQG